MENDMLHTKINTTFKIILSFEIHRNKVDSIAKGDNMYIIERYNLSGIFLNTLNSISQILSLILTSHILITLRLYILKIIYTYLFIRIRITYMLYKLFFVRDHENITHNEIYRPFSGRFADTPGAFILCSHTKCKVIAGSVSPPLFSRGRENALSLISRSR